MKYYKITNEQEYHTGLNVNLEGICFAREDILAFLWHGCWIREVTIPDNARIYEDLGSPRSWEADKIILGETRKIDLNIIKELVEEGADVHAYNDFALEWAAASDERLDIVKYLIEEGADIHTNNDAALYWAARSGQLAVVKYLVEQGADIHAGNDYVLRYAARSGHLAVVKYLVEQGADIHVENDRALRYATEEGHLDVVEYLKGLKK